MAFFGTPALAVPTLRALHESRHPVVCVVTQPDRGRGRGRKRTPSPVGEFAIQHDLALLRPEKVGESECVEALRDTAPDLGVVVAFGQFIPKKVRELPTRGYLINAHASLLPKYRGAAPIAWAILEDERETGISVMRVEREMDAGAVALVRRLTLAEDETTGSLEVRLGELAAEAIVAAVDEIAAGRDSWTEQDHDAHTLAPKLGREDAKLRFGESARALECRVRAMAPKPGAFALLDGEPLRILGASSQSGDSGEPNDPPGTIRLDADRRGLQIATGRGWLVPHVLQRAGGKALPVDAFLRGRPIEDGTRLEEPPSAEASDPEPRTGSSA